MNSSTKCLVVIDTNIFVSAFLYGGNPEKIFNFWKKEVFSLLLSPELHHEIISVLKRYKVEETVINELILLLNNKSIKIIPGKVEKVCRDEKDNMILALCGEGNADYLITGDKDLLILKKYKKTKILTPKEFLLKLNN